MHKENIFDLFNAQHANETQPEPVPAEVVTPEQVKEEVVTPDPAPEPQPPTADPEEASAGEEGGENV